MSFSKRIYPLPHYRGHYSHETPVTMSHWRVLVLIINSRSLLSINIDCKVQNRV